MTSIFVNSSVSEGNSVHIGGNEFRFYCTTSVGGTPMLVGELGKKYLCQAGDYNGFAETLVSLIANPIERAELGQNMRLRVFENFDIRDITAQYACMYNMLCSDRSQPFEACSNKKILPFLKHDNS